MPVKRICLYTADIMALTGQSESKARRTLRKIRVKEGKDPRDPISVEEFCRHTRLNSEEVSRALNTR